MKTSTLQTIHKIVIVIALLFIIIFLLTSCAKIESNDVEYTFNSVILDKELHSEVPGERAYIYASDGMVDVYELGGKGKYRWFYDQKWYKVEGNTIILDACGDGPPYEKLKFEIHSFKACTIHGKYYIIK